MSKAPANCGVINFGFARKSTFRFGHHKGRAAHAFNAARNDDFCRTASDGARTYNHCIESTGTKPVYSNGRNALAELRKQCGHARDVAVVLARLICATKNNFIDLNLLALYNCIYDVSCQIIRPHHGERSTMASDGCPLAATNINVNHIIVSNAGDKR